MKDSLGLIEIIGMSAAITVADHMVKSASIRNIDMENTRGAGYITLKIQGDVGAVEAALEIGVTIAKSMGKLVGYKIIPRASVSVLDVFCKEQIKDDRAIKVSDTEVELEMNITDGTAKKTRKAKN